MKHLIIWLLKFLVLIFPSCNYHWVRPIANNTLSISCVSGDEYGSLKRELVYAFTNSGQTKIVDKAGLYALQIIFLEEKNDIIGFRLDPQTVRGKTDKNLVADEKREYISVKVCLFERGIPDAILGPFEIRATLDYDYLDGDSLKDLVFTNPSGETQTTLQFSLGQLESVEMAREAVTHRLHTELARKIVDTVTAQWASAS